jgi:glycosyltransferase involved in cell wall biosynthesis
MNIVIINHYAGTEAMGMDYRPYSLARQWVAAGHDVTVLAASFSHLRSRQPVVAGRISEERIDGIRYNWVQTPAYAGNGAARVRNIFSFVGQTLAGARRLATRLRPDIVIASSTYVLDVLVARRMARVSRARFVFEVRDLWPLTLVELGGMSTRHPFVLLLQWAENYAYRTADRVVSALPAAAGYMERHGMAPEKWLYVPNGIDVAAWSDHPMPVPEAHRQALAELRARSRFILGYTGGHATSNALETLVDAAPALRDDGVSVLLVGQGPAKASLENRAARLRAANVLFLPPVPKAAVCSVLAGVDAAYIGWQKRAIYRYGTSSTKLMDYMMAERPVVHSTDALNDPVAESGCGLSVPPEDPSAVVDAVHRLMCLSDADRAAMGAKGRAHVVANNDYSVLARRFLAEL